MTVWTDPLGAGTPIAFCVTVLAVAVEALLYECFDRFDVHTVMVWDVWLGAWSRITRAVSR